MWIRAGGAGYGGHVADLLLVVALFAAWYRRTGRALVREPAAAPRSAPTTV